MTYFSQPSASLLTTIFYSTFALVFFLTLTFSEPSVSSLATSYLSHSILHRASHKVVLSHLLLSRNPFHFCLVKDIVSRLYLFQMSISSLALLKIFWNCSSEKNSEGTLKKRLCQADLSGNYSPCSYSHKRDTLVGHWGQVVVPVLYFIPWSH